MSYGNARLCALYYCLWIHVLVRRGVYGVAGYCEAHNRGDEQMTFEPQIVNEFIVRKMEEQRNRDLRLLADIARYAGVGVAVLLLVDAMLRAG
jgi:hypothetical protein